MRHTEGRCPLSSCPSLDRFGFFLRCRLQFSWFELLASGKWQVSVFCTRRYSATHAYMVVSWFLERIRSACITPLPVWIWTHTLTSECGRYMDIGHGHSQSPTISYYKMETWIAQVISMRMNAVATTMEQSSKWNAQAMQTKTEKMPFNIAILPCFFLFRSHFLRLLRLRSHSIRCTATSCQCHAHAKSLFRLPWRPTWRPAIAIIYAHVWAMASISARTTRKLLCVRMRLNDADIFIDGDFHLFSFLLVCAPDTVVDASWIDRLMLCGDMGIAFAMCNECHPKTVWPCVCCSTVAELMRMLQWATSSSLFFSPCKTGTRLMVRTVDWAGANKPNDQNHKFPKWKSRMLIPETPATTKKTIGHFWTSRN